VKDSERKLMQDIFISPLSAGLVSWIEAFPKAKITDTTQAKPTKAQKNAEIIFWLHMNEDRQEWLTNTISHIQQKYSNAKIVVLANAPIQAEALHVMSLGVMAYSHAYSPAKVLLEIKTVITNGGVWMGQDLLKRLIEVSTNLAGNQAKQVDQHLKLLTKREKQVALEAAKGLSNKEIARILKITERTVKAHLSSSFERLGAKDRLHLALMLNIKA
jgi:two-component system, NarL family, nitrate/nitrite response regulator NarL